MSLFRCKMCGGTLEVNESQTVAVCEYCGTEQTLPKLDDEKRANMYDRANHFRRNNEFDKAMGIYEQILSEDKTDAEAYWSLVLCRYGIEYVEDPSTHKRLPTVNRAQFTSVFDDDNYKSALEYADTRQKLIYEEEAKAINEIQKGILAISQKEEPFDVFICYKESDANGRRTVDSVLATDLYHQLTQEGFKVFFSRITLEDKLGTAYEPYIFAALNSAKVMVVLGTKAEYFNAVWVKNEWSRYLGLVKESKGKKVLIPAYKDMDPYDLPEEFSHLQAQDMSKLGFMQDLIRGIKKITSFDKPKTIDKDNVVVNNVGANVSSLLKRAHMFLEDREWTDANNYCEKILDIEPENADAYLAKLMAELKVRKMHDLKNLSSTFTHLNTYKKVIRFAPPELAKTLEGYNAEIKSRVEKIRAEQEKKRLEQERNEKERLEEEKRLREEKEAEKKRLEEEKRAEKARLAEEARILALKRKKKIIKTVTIISSVTVSLIVFIVLLNVRIIPSVNYSKGISFLEEKAYDEAIAAFTEAGDYKDAKEMIKSAYYSKGEDLFNRELYEDAIAAFVSAQDYKDSVEKKQISYYNLGKSALEQKDYRLAFRNFIMAKGYSDSADILRSINNNVISADFHTVALKQDGTVVAAGFNDYGQCDVSDWKDIISVSASIVNTVGLKADGTVVAVGDNEYGQCNVSDWTGIVAIESGYYNTFGLKYDGTVVAVGRNSYGNCDVSDWTDIVAISAGDNHTVGLKADGTVVAVGSNGYDACEVTEWSDIVAISAKENRTVGLKADGTVVSAGSKFDVSSWSDIVEISVGTNHTIGLKSDGTVVAAGSNEFKQCDVSEWTYIVAIYAGKHHSVGLKSDGTVVAVGYNEAESDVADWSDIKLPLS